MVIDKLYDIILYSTVINQVGLPVIDAQANPNKRRADKFLDDEELIEKSMA